MATKEQEAPKEEPKETPTPEVKAETEAANGVEKQFTQTDVDRIVRDRLAREQQKFADYEDIKAKAARLDEIEEANKSELEKARSAAEKAEAERDAAKAEAAQVRLKSAVIARASGMNFIDPEDAFALLPKDGLSLSADGSVEGLEDGLKALAEAKPHLLKTGKPEIPKVKPTNPSGDNARGGEEETDAQRARRLGVG